MDELTAFENLLIQLRQPVRRIISAHFGATAPLPETPPPVTHHHRHREILLVIDCPGKVVLGNQIYELQPGDAVFFETGQLHDAYINKCDSRHLWLMLYPKRMPAAYLEKSSGEEIRHLMPDPISSAAAALLNSRWDQLLASSAEDLDFCRSQLLAALELVKGDLIKGDIANTVSGKTVPPVIRQRNVVDLISDCIESRLGNNCSLAELAELTGYSGCYLSKLFHACAGKTIGMAVNEVRMRYVLSCKLHTSCKEMADALGFSTAAAFWKWRHKNHALEKAMLENRPVVSQDQ